MDNLLGMSLKINIEMVIEKKKKVDSPLRSLLDRDLLTVGVGDKRMSPLEYIYIL